MDRDRLKQVVVDLSVSDSYLLATKEWRYKRSFWNDEGTHCVCGKFIKEECLIENQINGKQLIIGNKCVCNFKPEIGLVHAQIIRARNKILKNPDRIPDQVLVDYCLGQNIIDKADFYYLIGKTKSDLRIRTINYKMVKPLIDVRRWRTFYRDRKTDLFDQRMPEHPYKIREKLKTFDLDSLWYFYQNKVGFEIGDYGFTSDVKVLGFFLQKEKGIVNEDTAKEFLFEKITKKLGKNYFQNKDIQTEIDFLDELNEAS